MAGVFKWNAVGRRVARLDSVDTLSVLLKYAFMCVWDSSSFAGGVNAVFDVRIMCPDVSAICPWRRQLRVNFAGRLQWALRRLLIPENGTVSVQRNGALPGRVPARLVGAAGRAGVFIMHGAWGSGDAPGLW
jgi:hypothetical protein